MHLETWGPEAALFLTAELEDITSSCLVTCSAQWLDAFDAWYNSLDELSQGDLMDWMVKSLGRETSDVA